MDGNIAAAYLFSDPVALVCNDEGKLISLDLNRTLRDVQGQIYDIVAVTFLVVGLARIPSPLCRRRWWRSTWSTQPSSSSAWAGI